MFLIRHIRLCQLNLINAVSGEDQSVIITWKVSLILSKSFIELRSYRFIVAKIIKGINNEPENELFF